MQDTIETRSFLDIEATNDRFSGFIVTFPHEYLPFVLNSSVSFCLNLNRLKVPISFLGVALGLMLGFAFFLSFLIGYFRINLIFLLLLHKLEFFISINRFNVSLNYVTHVMSTTKDCVKFRIVTSKINGIQFLVVHVMLKLLIIDWKLIRFILNSI